MKSNFTIPFIQNYKRSKRPFITMNRIQTFLGASFYPRLNTIYGNILQAIAKKNYRYISANVQGTLAHRLISQITQADNQRFRVKIKNPLTKIVLVKPQKSKKYFKFREQVWSNDVTKIGITCNVFFGQKFDREEPFGKQNVKKIRVGQFRYLIYDPEMAMLQNFKNWFTNHTYEFIVNYQSKLHLQVFSFGEKDTPNIYDNKKQDTVCVSEIIMRSGADKFDWVITQINGINGK